MEKIEQFLEECKNSPVAAELVKSANPQSVGEIVKHLADVAQKLGCDVTEAELTEYYENTLKKIKAKTDAVAAKIIAEPDTVLEEAAGGQGEVDKGCGLTHHCGVEMITYPNSDAGEESGGVGYDCPTLVKCDLIPSGT